MYPINDKMSILKERKVLIYKYIIQEKKMKKIIAFLTTALLCMNLAGCGGEVNNNVAPGNVEPIEEESIAPIVKVDAGWDYSVALCEDGKVLVKGELNVAKLTDGDITSVHGDGWTDGDIVDIAAGGWHVAALKKDGTVVADGKNEDGRCDVSEWTDIVDIAAGHWHTVGVKSDGTVVAAGSNSDDGECEVSGWTDVVKVAAGVRRTIGIKSDGTLYAAGDFMISDGSNFHNFKDNILSQTDVADVSIGDYHILCLKTDGTVVSIGPGRDGENVVWDWSSVKQISASRYSHSISAGLDADGKLLVTSSELGYYKNANPKIDKWTDIKQFAFGYEHMIALKNDGTVIAAGNNIHKECDVAAWNK